MLAPQRFRSALNGFNREDVVNYIEYLNNHYTSQLEQLKNQLQESKNTVPGDVVADLQTQLNAALQRCEDLEAQLATHEEVANRELEAYRRAEETERKAAQRANAIYEQAQAALDNATSMAEAATVEFSEVATRTEQQLKEYQASLLVAVDRFKSAAATLHAVKDE